VRAVDLKADLNFLYGPPTKNVEVVARASHGGPRPVGMP
jgi:hypothetical protein